MSMNTRLPTRPDDDLDRLFTAYFQAERPAPWPACPRPWADPARPAPAVDSDATARSRWALAASVALLFGGCWYLSGHMSDGKARRGLDLEGTGANAKHLKDLGKAPPAFLQPPSLVPLSHPAPGTLRAGQFCEAGSSTDDFATDEG